MSDKLINTGVQQQQPHSLYVSIFYTESTVSGVHSSESHLSPSLPNTGPAVSRKRKKWNENQIKVEEEVKKKKKLLFLFLSINLESLFVHRTHFKKILAFRLILLRCNFYHVKKKKKKPTLLPKEPAHLVF